VGGVGGVGMRSWPYGCGTGVKVSCGMDYCPGQRRIRESEVRDSWVWLYSYCAYQIKSFPP